MSFSPTANSTADKQVAAWRARSLERSLAGAQARSVERSDRLVDAARSLANETGAVGFTVAQVADRAGLSFKSFYRCFAGKDDLLVALLEEESRAGAELLGSRMAKRNGSPADVVRAYVTGLLRLAATPEAEGYAGVLVREHRRLGETVPDALHAALAPLVTPLAEALDGHGVAHADRAAELVFGVALTGVADVVLRDADPKALGEELATFCWSGLGGRA